MNLETRLSVAPLYELWRTSSSMFTHNLAVSSGKFLRALAKTLTLRRSGKTHAHWRLIKRHQCGVEVCRDGRERCLCFLTVYWFCFMLVFMFVTLCLRVCVGDRLRVYFFFCFYRVWLLVGWFVYLFSLSCLVFSYLSLRHYWSHTGTHTFYYCCCTCFLPIPMIYYA